MRSSIRGSSGESGPSLIDTLAAPPYVPPKCEHPPCPAGDAAGTIAVIISAPGRAPEHAMFCPACAKSVPKQYANVEVASRSVARRLEADLVEAPKTSGSDLESAILRMIGVDGTPYTRLTDALHAEPSEISEIVKNLLDDGIFIRIPATGRLRDASLHYPSDLDAADDE